MKYKSNSIVKCWWLIKTRFYCCSNGVDTQSKRVKDGIACRLPTRRPLITQYSPHRLCSQNQSLNVCHTIKHVCNQFSTTLFLWAAPYGHIVSILFTFAPWMIILLALARARFSLLFVTDSWTNSSGSSARWMSR